MLSEDCHQKSKGKIPQPDGKAATKAGTFDAAQDPAKGIYISGQQQMEKATPQIRRYAKASLTETLDGVGPEAPYKNL